MALHLMVCTPTAGFVNANYMGAILRLTGIMATVPLTDDMTQSFDMRFRLGSNIPQGREVLCEQFLESEATHMLFVDDDMGFEPEAVVSLIRRNVPIVGCNYRMRQPPYAFTARGKDGALATTDESTGLEAVGGMGFGLCLMKREVLETVRAPRFTPEWLPEQKTYTTEDMPFFKKVRITTDYVPYVDHDASKYVWHHAQFAVYYNEDLSNLNKIFLMNGPVSRNT